MDYKSKYLKYKNKYLELKNQIEGGTRCISYDNDPVRCESDPNCVWDFRRVCVEKSEHQPLTKEIEGLIGSHLPHSNIEHKFILKSIYSIITIKTYCL